ncbi:serine hydrolase [Philodulcilactobacillus myokoensis]|uniref:Serine hydrolase n=1 Tax=Philodulcilactobacillus myokoensis TaxID=2929573 RepID=A0A9W6ESS3_9LACO|nr:serine hydrolase domain-containing protein [Philodulcilactobacillus myokoensis]GLB47090.1 serine hydrolase [Philodulcilactobacillus myokoensis]
MKFKKTINAVHSLVDNHIIPGATYAIIDHDQVHSEVIGNKELVPRKIKLHSNQIYDLASLTKVVGTTNVILQLIQQQKLKTGDSISKYLPEWKYPKVLVRHLLTHTSDIEGYIPNRNQLPAKKLLKAILGLHVGPYFDRKVIYSDYNFILLGLIAKRIMKKPIQQLIKEMVFEPLKMNDSSFNPTDKKRCVPTQYTSHGLVQGTVDDPKAQILGADCGSAGMFSTLHDLAKFVHSIAHPNANPILTKKTIDELFIDHTSTGNLGRSWGWRVIKNQNENYIWQGGYTGTFIIIDRQHDRSMIFLSNRIHPKAPNEKYIPLRDQIVRIFANEK